MPLLLAIRGLVARECLSKLSSYETVTDQEFGITYKVKSKICQLSVRRFSNSESSDHYILTPCYYASVFEGLEFW